MSDATHMAPGELKEGWYWATRSDINQRFRVEVKLVAHMDMWFTFIDNNRFPIAAFDKYVPIPSEAEVQEMRRTIEKLPKTADGVRIYPGIEVWSAKSATRHEVTWVHEHLFKAICECHREETTCASNDIVTYEYDTRVPFPESHKVYSTREAALSHQSKESEASNGK